MLRIINATVIVLFALYHAPVQAQKVFTLSPNESKMLSSPWAVTATCTVQVAKHGKIKVNVVKNNCSVNGKNLSSGQSTSLRVINNSNISVSAEAGTEINLINMGDESMQAVCST
ncbi:MAG: hypothetical protein WC627_02920 [Legionella sp.]|jgi:hypothetical protein